MRWSVELWDRYEECTKHLSKGLEFNTRYQMFLKKRSEADNAYARELKKIADQFSPETDQNDR